MYFNILHYNVAIQALYVTTLRGSNVCNNRNFSFFDEFAFA